MNILFISKLTGKLWAGPNTSVPAQVLAQSRIDNVMWLNLNHICLPGWRRKEYQFINKDDIKNPTLKDLPYPFNKPDFIIFQQVYSFRPNDRILRSVIKSDIPYSIVPRSSLTLIAQQKHSLKKKIANFLFYNEFIRKAYAIQYLTECEKSDSDKFFPKKSYVIPNGTEVIENFNKTYEGNGIRIVYIGRLEMFQKGLDNLITAISAIQDDLRSADVYIELFGPNRESSVEKLTSIIKENKIEDLVLLKPEVFGKEKEKILKSADVSVMTSRFEGLPMGLIEALSYGLPCIVTEGTYLMDEIEAYDAGWGAGSSVNSIKESLLKLISESKLLPIKSSNAKKLAKRYSWDYLAQKLHDCIRATL